MIRIRLTRCFGGFDEPREFDLGEIVVGKPRDGHMPDLDLSPDPGVSRRHLRIFADGDQAVVEDRNSTYGTRLNDRDIKGTGRHPLHTGDRLELGKTLLRVEYIAARPSGKRTGQPPAIHDSGTPQIGA